MKTELQRSTFPLITYNAHKYKKVTTKEKQRTG